MAKDYGTGSPYLRAKAQWIQCYDRGRVEKGSYELKLSALDRIIALAIQRKKLTETPYISKLEEALPCKYFFKHNDPLVLFEKLTG